MPAIDAISTPVPAGASSAAARSRAALNDAFRRLPAIPTILVMPSAPLRRWMLITNGPFAAVEPLRQPSPPRREWFAGAWHARLGQVASGGRQAGVAPPPVDLPVRTSGDQEDLAGRPPSLEVPMRLGSLGEREGRPDAELE